MVTGDVLVSAGARAGDTGDFNFFTPTIEFDGHRFHASIVHGAATPCCLYLAHQARRGDAVAVDALNACQVVIMDVHGKAYWPVEGG